MNKRWIVIAISAGFAAALAPAVQAQDSGSWLVRGRALYLDSANKSETTPDLKLSVNNKAFPELDVSYFITPNMALELVLTYPQKHDLRSDGNDIGTVKHLPPTLSFQYHFTGMGWRPYVGAGLNYTRFSEVEFTPAVQAALDPSIKKDSWGPAIGLGADFPVGGGWLVNADLKKVWIKTTVYSAGNDIGTFRIDPLLLSVGFGRRF